MGEDLYIPGSHLISPWGTHQHHSVMAGIKRDGSKGERGTHHQVVEEACKDGDHVTGHKGEPMLLGEKHQSYALIAL